MANECIPVYEPGEAVTAHADAAITGKRFVRISAAKQAGSVLTPSGADTTTGGNVRCDQDFSGGVLVPAFGVADRDCPSGGKFGVLKGGAVPMEASAAIAAGVRVMPSANGRVALYAAGAGPDVAAVMGITLTASGAAGDEILVDLDAD